MATKGNLSHKTRFTGLGVLPMYPSGEYEEKALATDRVFNGQGVPGPVLLRLRAYPPRRWTGSGGLRRVVEDDGLFHLRRRRQGPGARPGGHRELRAHASGPNGASRCCSSSPQGHGRDYGELRPRPCHVSGTSPLTPSPPRAVNSALGGGSSYRQETPPPPCSVMLLH